MYNHVIHVRSYMDLGGAGGIYPLKSSWDQTTLWYAFLNVFSNDIHERPSFSQCPWWQRAAFVVVPFVHSRKHTRKQRRTKTFFFPFLTRWRRGRTSVERNSVESSFFTNLTLVENITANSNKVSPDEGNDPPLVFVCMFGYTPKNTLFNFFTRRQQRPSLPTPKNMSLTSYLCLYCPVFS
jgi:hypothetical protein